MARRGARSLGNIGSILAAVVVTAVVCIFGLVIISHVILNEMIAESGADASIAVLLFCAVFIGGQVLFKNEERKLIYPVVVGAIVVIMMMFGGFLMDGEFQNISRNLIIVSIGCTLSTLRFLKGSRKKRGRNIGYR